MEDTRLGVKQQEMMWDEQEIKAMKNIWQSLNENIEEIGMVNRYIFTCNNTIL